MLTLPRRQVHIDFHTSEHIPDVGARFDAETFVDTLKRAHVNSVNLFAKCHHGWSYYDTRVGARHPNLKFDLLRAQYDAVKAAGIAAVIYYSCGWEERSARMHPEWREISPDGTFHCAGNGRNLDTGWKFMCFNTPYLDHMTEQLRELADVFPDADGYWLDIIHYNQCCCSYCIASMNAAGLDWQNEADRMTQAYRTRERYMKETNAACRKRRADVPVFHNSGHLPQGDRRLLGHFSHLEIESLPTGGWGYDHFPLSAAYARTIGKPYLGMTGKFHTMWGEFGGYKHPSALKYENALMGAFGAGCSIGDQLHPSGEIDASTYAIIAEAYAEAEVKEPFYVDVKPVVEIGVLSAASLYATGDTGHAARDSMPDNGAVRMLLESHLLFDVVDRHADFGAYKLLILPDVIRPDRELHDKLARYLAAGGRILLTGDSGFSAETGAFLFDVGADVGEPSPFSPDFVLAPPELRPEFVDNPFVMYAPSHRVKVTDGASLGDIYDPYFNRTPKHFCSHQHTPPRPEASGFQSGSRKGGVAYLAHPVFSIYWDKGAVTTKRYTAKVIEAMLDGAPVVRTSLPSHGRVTVQRQEGKKRSIVHLLCASPISRGTYAGRPIEVVEDVVVVPDVEVTIAAPQAVGRVMLEPQGTPLSADIREGEVSFRVDRVAGHQMVVLHDA
jgi:hypothetical protein